MSLEKCKLCNEFCTPWVHVNGHICQDCVENSRAEEWIKLNDKPPVKAGKYLVYINKLFPWIGISQFSNGEFIESGVSYWMNLPEKPE